MSIPLHIKTYCCHRNNL